jgi:hypothetical protein
MVEGAMCHRMCTTPYIPFFNTLPSYCSVSSPFPPEHHLWGVGPCVMVWASLEQKINTCEPYRISPETKLNSMVDSLPDYYSWGRTHTGHARLYDSCLAAANARTEISYSHCGIIPYKRDSYTFHVKCKLVYFTGWLHLYILCIKVCSLEPHFAATGHTVSTSETRCTPEQTTPPHSFILIPLGPSIVLFQEKW